MRLTSYFLICTLIPAIAVFTFGKAGRFSPLRLKAAISACDTRQQSVRQALSEAVGNPLVYQQTARKTVVKKTSTRSTASRRSGNSRGQYPEASERMLTEKDVQYLSAWGKTVMINEIYARHGLTFSNRMLRNHFRKEKWYRPKYRNVNKMLTDTERRNIDFIRQYQDRK